MKRSPAVWLGDSRELLGCTFGTLVVEAPAPRQPDGQVALFCRCGGCGRLAVRRARDLVRGLTRSCARCSPAQRPPRGATEPPAPADEARAWLLELRADRRRIARELHRLDAVVVGYLHGLGHDDEERRLDAQAAGLAVLEGADAAELAELFGVRLDAVGPMIERGRVLALEAVDARIERNASAARALRLRLLHAALSESRSAPKSKPEALERLGPHSSRPAQPERNSTQ